MRVEGHIFCVAKMCKLDGDRTEDDNTWCFTGLE